MSSDAFTSHPLFFLITSANGASDGSTNGAPSSLIADVDLLPTVIGCLLFLVTSNGLLSTVLSRFSSLVPSNSLLSAVLGRLLSFVAGGIPLSTILGCFLALFASGGHLSAVFGNSYLSPLTLAGSWALFLTSTPSHARCSSLPSLPLFYSFLSSSPILIAHNLALLTEKKLFDQVLMIQKPINSIRQKEELDLSFCQYSCNVSIKMIRSLQSKLYNPKPVRLLKGIPLLSFLF